MRPRARRVLLVLAGLALVGLAGSFPALYVRSRQHFRAAEQALQRNELRLARHHFGRSLSLWARNARASLRAAQAARRQDAHAEAERLLTECERRHGATPATELEWLLLGVQQGDYAGHETFLQSAADQEHPDALLILEALAKGYMNTYRWSSMVGSLDRMLERQPGHLPALVLRGKGWEGLRRLDNARKDYERALALSPEAGEARLGLAEILTRLGYIRDALHHYEVLRQQQPENSAMLLGLARCWFDAAELEQAQQLLDTLVAGQPDDVAGLVEAGRLALRRGRPAEAVEKLQRATTLAPWHREAHQLLLRCLETLGRSAEAQQCQERLRALAAADVHLARLGLRYRQAPRDPAIRHELGRWCLQNGQEQAGVRWLCTGLLADPHHTPCHAALADYFERTGQPRRAAEHRQRAPSSGHAEVSR